MNQGLCGLGEQSPKGGRRLPPSTAGRAGQGRASLPDQAAKAVGAEVMGDH